MKKFLTALVAVFALVSVQAFAFPVTSFSAARASSFSAARVSSFRASSFSASRSYSAPSFRASSYRPTTSSTFRTTAFRSAPQFRPVSGSGVRVAPRSFTAPSYSRSYHSTSVWTQPHNVSNAGWYAFAALVAYNAWQDSHPNGQAGDVPNAPLPPKTDELASLSYDQLARIVADDNVITKEELKVVALWRKLTNHPAPWEAAKK